MPEDTKALAVFKEMENALAPYPPDRYHRLMPTAAQEMSPLFRPAAVVVRVNAQDPRDVYDTPGSGGKTVCLHSQALERIGNAMGIDWSDTRYEHDHAKEPYLCTAHVSGWMVDALGQRRRLSASAKSDLRDGSPTAAVLKGGLGTARQFICERTESRARNRGIKKIGNMPTSFTKDELSKPFVAIRFRLDESQPDVRRALIDAGTRASEEVFGQRPGPAIEAGTATSDDEVHEGEFREQHEQPKAAPAEPDVVEPESAPDDSAAIQAAAIAARGHVEKIRAELKWGNDARKKAPSDSQVGLVAGQIARAIGADAALSADAKKTTRRAVLGYLWGAFEEYAELSNDQVAATIDWATAQPDEVRAVLRFLAAVDPAMAPVAAALAPQATLL